MHSSILNRIVERFIYSAVLACLLVSLVNPTSINAAPPPPVTPTPAALPPEIEQNALAEPDLPSSTLLQFEKARAKAAAEVALRKYLDHWGPRYQTSPIEVTVDGDWAIGTAHWVGSEKPINGPVNILVKRQPDGGWMAMLPDGTQESRKMIEAAPTRLISNDLKQELLTNIKALVDPLTDDEDPDVSSQNLSKVDVSLLTATPERFLALPFNDNGTIPVRSGWYYDNGVYHGSTDWNLPNDTPVYAAADGVAMLSYQPKPSDKDGYGYFIYIKHNNGYYTLYAHLNRGANGIKEYPQDQRWNQNYNEWTPVVKGQVIGYVGKTGTTFYHLHFEARTGSYSDSSSRVDSYGLYQKAASYPPNTVINPGPNYLWISNPPSFSGQNGLCSAPSLTSPGNDYVSPGNTITFVWNQTTCSNQNGYYLRVGTSNGASDVVSDLGVQGLQTNYSFGSQWYNRDLYWSVRANATGAAWSTDRKFRIETGQNNSSCSDYITNFGFSPETPSNATNISVHANISTSFPNFRAARLRVDNGGGFCEGSSYTYSCSNWDTRNLSDGDHTIVLEVDDNQGSSWDSPATCSRIYHLDPRPNPPPSSFNLTSPSDGISISQNDAVYLQWETSNGAAQYQVHLWSDSMAERLSTWSSSTNWNVGQLAPGKYYWKVVAQNAYGVQESNQTWSFTVQQSLPNAPSTLTAETVSQSQINLSWSDNSANETGFRLFREGLLIHTFGSGETTYQDTGLDCGRGYNYYVVAFNNAGQSGPSGSVGATTDACPPTVPPTPNPISPNGTTFNCHDTITLSWDFIGLGVEYYIETWGANTKNSGPQESSLLYLGEQNSGQTFWHVKARYAGQTTYSNWGNTASFTVNSCPQFPDLRPFTPDGYETPVVPSNIDGTHTSSILYTNQPTYFDWSYINEGNGMAAGTYTTEVWVDDHKVLGYPWQDFSAGQVWTWDDWQDTITANESGWHTLKMVTDSGNTITESDETNNEWSQRFYWYLPSNDVHEPNDNVNNATHIQYGQTITAADIFPMAESDIFYFWGEANDTIIADVDAQALGSRLDSVLELYDSDGASLLLPPSDDVDGRDPKVLFTLPHNGTYFLRVKNYYNDQGGGDFYYRLKLTGGKQAPYMTDFETNTTGWTTSGLWHEVDAGSPYPMSASPSHSFWYGQDSTGNYDTGVANNGDLISPEIYIPPTEKYYFRFKYWYETETQAGAWDQRWVQYSIDHGPFYDLLQLQDDQMVYWHNSPVISLADVGGHTIQFRFHFDTLDATGNAYRGWYIDDFSISTASPPLCNDPYEQNDTISSATPLAYGDALNANICANGDTDYYQFNAQAGDAVVIDIDARVNASSLDSFVTLFNNSGEILATNDDDAVTYDSKLGYVINTTGTYYIRVRDYWHPSPGGTDYNYSIHLYTDKESPSTAEIISPQSGAWINPTQETITANAYDAGSGILRVEFLWHSADWQNSDWVWLGADRTESNGWTYNLGTSTFDEQAGGAVYAWAFDYVGNYSSAGTWNLGIDRTPPEVTLETTPMYGDAPFLDFYINWSGSDNLSGITGYDVQVRDGPSGEWQEIYTNTLETVTRLFGEDGHTYYFQSRAHDAAGNVGEYIGGDGQDQHYVQICPVAADSFESDNSAAAAKTLTVGIAAQQHNFNAERDEDWIKFNVQKDKVYILNTENIGTDADTVLTLYDRDGATELLVNDDYEGMNYASRIDWRPTVDGTYYAMISHWDPSGYGCTTSYIVSVTDSSPTISSLSPDMTVMGSPTFTLTVNGSNYATDSVVRWNGTDLTTTYSNSSQLSATVPASLISSAGTASISIYNPAFGVMSNLVTFAINNPTPDISSISPSWILAGSTGFTLTANGNNFVTGSVIRWDGADLPTTRVSSTQLTANIDSGRLDTGGTHSITIYNSAPGGGVSPARTFTINNPAPTLTTINPTSVTAGSATFELTATGSNFVAGSVIRWNGEDLTTSQISGTQLTATIDTSRVAAAGTVEVTVFTPAPGGGETAPRAFTITKPALILTSISPSSVTTGSREFTLTATGSNFPPTAVIQWDGADLATTWISSTQLTATIEASKVANGGTASITVRDTAAEGETSTAMILTINNPVPVLTSLNPSSAMAGDSGFTLTVAGNNFTPSSVIRWDGTVLTTTFVSSTQLKANIGSSRLATGGTHTITVFNPAPGGGIATAQTFTVNNPAPVLTHLSPTTVFTGGPAFPLTLTGDYFVASSVVRWNGSALPTTWVSRTQLTASVDAAKIATAGTAVITVFTPIPEGGETTALTLTIENPVPVLSSLSPESGTIGSEGFSLTVTGSGFVTGSVIRWNGEDLVTNRVSSTRLITTIDAARVAAVGSVEVTVFNPAPAGGESAALTFNIYKPVPVISAISPSSVPMGSDGFILTVTGSHFENGAVIRWNGTDLETTFINEDELHAQIDASRLDNSEVVNITVFNPDPGGRESAVVMLTISGERKIFLPMIVR